MRSGNRYPFTTDAGRNFNDGTSQGFRESEVRSLKRTKRYFESIVDMIRRNSTESPSSSSFGTPTKPITDNHSWTGNITRSSYVLHDSGPVQNGPTSTFNYRYEPERPSRTLARRASTIRLEPTITYVTPEYNPDALTVYKKVVDPTDGKIRWTSEQVTRNNSTPQSEWLARLLNRSTFQ